MKSLIAGLHPFGWTGRPLYWQCMSAIAVSVLGAMFLSRMNSELSWIWFPVIAVTEVAILLLTIRRLRDAGVSVYLVVLFLFPMTISIGAVDIDAVIRFIPIAVGLCKASQPSEARLS